MKRARRRLIAALFVAGVLCSPPAFGQGFWDTWDEGLDAVAREDWQRVVELMSEAIEQHPQEGYQRRTGTLEEHYYPYFYLGLAHYRLGNCRPALDAWSHSEAQGQIREMPEYSDLQTFRDECQQQLGSLDAAVRGAENALAEAEDAARPISRLRGDSELSAVWQQEAGLGPRHEEANSLTSSARARLDAGRRNGNLAALDESISLAGRAREIYGEIESEAEEVRRRLAAEPERTRQPSEEAGRVVKAEPPPARDRPRAQPKSEPARPASGSSTAVRPVELDRGVDAFFSSDYQRVVETLDPDAFEDSRARLHAALFLAAARFALYARGGESDGELLEAVISGIELCRSLDPDFSPDPRYFSPRFIELYAETPGR